MSNAARVVGDCRAIATCVGTFLPLSNEVDCALVLDRISDAQKMPVQSV